MRKYRLNKLTLLACLLTVLFPQTVGALSGAQTQIYNSGIYYYDVNSGDGTCTSASGSSGCSCLVDQTGSVYKFVQTLAFKESGDNPTATNSTSDASGKYQFLSTTWQSKTKSYYSPGIQYATAAAAPEPVQDAVAYIEYSVKSVEFKGDLTKMAIYHYYPAANDDPSKLDIVPRGNTESPRQYAQNFINDYNAGKGQNVPLKFTQAPDFDSQYAQHVGKPYANDSSTGNSTGSDCTSGVPADKFVFYDQGDPKWSSHPIYNGDTIGYAGCGPTSAAMVIATLANSSITPVQTGDYMTQISGFSDEGATTDGLTKVVEHWGLKAKSLGTDFSAAANIIRQGGLVIAGGQGGAPYTAGGHVVVLRGLDSNGKFLIGNPAPGIDPGGQDQAFSIKDLQSPAPGTLYMIGVTK